MKKEERNQEIAKMLKNYTVAEVAQHFGISRQRVHQIAKTEGVDLSNKLMRHFGKVDETGLPGKIPDREIAKMLGVSAYVVGKIRQSMGIDKFSPRKPIGCEDCKKNPHAKGLCRKCYQRLWRMNRVG